MRGPVVIAGGTGFIGRGFAQRFTEAGRPVTVLGRGLNVHVPGATYQNWDGKTLGDWRRVLEGAELLVNLAGKSVDCRYNEGNKRAILASRTDSTTVLGEALRQAKAPPRHWINSSTATIYRHAEDRPMDEGTGEIGSGFSVEVAKAWERSFFEADVRGIRKTAIRAAIVLGREGGALIPFRNLVRLGFGGAQGGGRQKVSWVHEEDLFDAVRFIEDSGLEGVVNCSSPRPVTNGQFMGILRRTLRMPFGLPTPRVLLGPGAFFLRTETELVLKSRWVLPGRLLQAGYRFKHPDLGEALANLL